MNTAESIRIYETVKKYSNEETAKQVINDLEGVIREEITDNLQNLATKADLPTKDFVKAEVSSAKADIIKWMFIFWIGQVLATAALIYLKS